jgi:hypothetical protein
MGTVITMNPQELIAIALSKRSAELRVTFDLGSIAEMRGRAEEDV